MPNTTNFRASVSLYINDVKEKFIALPTVF